MLPTGCGVLLTLWVCLEVSTPRPIAAATVDMILWFDTEDYLLQADDDASKRLAEMLSDRGIRATFKVVGEKARVLEQRGRQDVVAALKKHDIGYHANYHSVHPTPSEYLADCGLLDGIAEFVRREGGGAADVRRVFNVPTLSCYGQPGSSWGSQSIAALRAIGVTPHGTPCYVDEGDHVGLNEQPFWYAGSLVVYHMGRNWTRMELHDPAAVAPAKVQATAIADRLRAQGGGLISIFYHPCEWVHREFWDGVNFRRGANPPREEWKAPPQRSAAETEAAFARFGDYVDHLRSIPGTQFVTASDLPLLYRDAGRDEGVGADELLAIARQIALAEGKNVNFLIYQDRAYSAADQFELLTVACESITAGRQVIFPIRNSGLLGPARSPATSLATAEIPWTALRDSLRDVASFLRTEHRMPDRVFIGSSFVAPENFLLTLADFYQNYAAKQELKMTGMVRLASGGVLSSTQYVAEDTPDLFGGWVIHREGFRAPKILEVARCQAWTLKPALRVKTGLRE